MDLKVLFHNPESLSEDELYQLRQKLQHQRAMPWTAAFFGGFAVYFLDCAVLHRTADPRRAALGLVLGFALGAYGSYHIGTTIHRVRSEEEIINRWEIFF